MAAALPLVTERGRAVTTAEIARAAGVAEGTVFWAFSTKEELLDACVHEVTRTDRLRARIEAAARRDTLEDRLLAVAEALEAHLRRAVPLVLSLGAPGTHHRSQERGGMVAVLTEAVGQLLAREVEAGRIVAEPAVAARALVGLVFAAVFQQAHAGIEPAATHDLVAIFLDGVRPREADRP
ncbi:MAG: helix-turn-helix domain-containing protein [Nitriliruptoraceae bacterium]